jgi:Autophagocytosis associated protein, active-site domain
VCLFACVCVCVCVCVCMCRMVFSHCVSLSYPPLTPIVDGRVLSMDEVWDDLPVAYQDEAARWTFISQEEHPVLGIPYYFVHPCKTASLLDALTRRSAGGSPATASTRSGVPVTMAGARGSAPACVAESAISAHVTATSLDAYLIRWLSLVAPVVGYRVDPALLLCTV